MIYIDLHPQDLTTLTLKHEYSWMRDNYRVLELGMQHNCHQSN